MERTLISRWGFVTIGSLAFVAFVACSSSKAKTSKPLELGEADPTTESDYQDEETTLNGAPPETLPGSSSSDPGPEPEPEPEPTVDGGKEGGAPVTPSVCAGKANGITPNAAKPTEVCCSQKLVLINSVKNCGGCGIACVAGQTCGEVRVGEWGCHCTLNSDCVAAGYGAASTCYTTAAGSYCNCQCPVDGVCAGVCAGGATCYDITGQNYCSYH